MYGGRLPLPGAAVILTYCDRCKKVIDEVAWALVAVNAQRPDVNRPIVGPIHLHWECVPLWDRSAGPGGDE